MFRNKGIDQSDDLSLSLFILALRRNGINPVIRQPDPSERPPQKGKNEVMRFKINPKTRIKNRHIEPL
jgi:hypothetical protein